MLLFPVGVEITGYQNPYHRDKLIDKNMDEIVSILNYFNTTTLEDLDVIKLLNRYDTKFIFCRDKLLAVFDFLSTHYEVLEIDNRYLLNMKTSIMTRMISFFIINTITENLTGIK